MKRIASAILCLVLMVTLAIPFTARADEAQTNSDYKLTYSAKIVSSPQIVSSDSNPQWYRAKITEANDHFRMTGTTWRSNSFHVTVPQGVADYTISFVMAVDLSEYESSSAYGQNIYYGFGEAANVTDGNFYRQFAETAGGINDTQSFMSFSKIKNMFDLRGFNSVSAGSDDEKLMNEVSEGKALTYTFHVEGGKLAKISATAEIEGTQVTCSYNGPNYTVTSFDKFGIGTRTKDNFFQTIDIQSVTVAYGDQSQTIVPYTHYVGTQSQVNAESYNVRFVAGVGDYTRYDTLGFKVVAKNSEGVELKNIEWNCQYVYNSLLAVSDEGTVSDETAAKYGAGTLAALAIHEIPKSLGEVSFYVTPIYTVDGVALEGATYRVVYNDGALVSQTAVAD